MIDDPAWWIESGAAYVVALAIAAVIAWAKGDRQHDRMMLLLVLVWGAGRAFQFVSGSLSPYLLLTFIDLLACYLLWRAAVWRWEVVVLGTFSAQVVLHAAGFLGLVSPWLHSWAVGTLGFVQLLVTGGMAYNEAGGRGHRYSVFRWLGARAAWPRNRQGVV